MVGKIPSRKDGLGLPLPEVHHVAMKACLHVRQHGLPITLNQSLPIFQHCVGLADEACLSDLARDIDELKELQCSGE